MGQKAVTQCRPFPGRQAPVWPGNTWSSKASRESSIRGSGLPAQAASGQEITDPAVRTWKHRGDKRKPRQAAPPGGLAWASSRRCPVTTESLSDAGILSSELECSTNQRLEQGSPEPRWRPTGLCYKKDS